MISFALSFRPCPLIPLGVSSIGEEFQPLFGLPKGWGDEHSWAFAFIGYTRNDSVARTVHPALMEFSVW